jgi:hypothetical protein
MRNPFRRKKRAHDDIVRQTCEWMSAYAKTEVKLELLSDADEVLGFIALPLTADTDAYQADFYMHPGHNATRPHHFVAQQMVIRGMLPHHRPLKISYGLNITLCGGAVTAVFP